MIIENPDERRHDVLEEEKSTIESGIDEQLNKKFDKEYVEYLMKEKPIFEDYERRGTLSTLIQRLGDFLRTFLGGRE